MKRTAVALTLILALFSALVAGFVSPVVAEGTIYIRSDGSVEGTDRIQQDGAVYRFTGDIDIRNVYVQTGIRVLKDNIVIDGSHFSIYRHDYDAVGIDLSGRNNVTVKNLKISGFWRGINLKGASNNIIQGNEIIGTSQYPTYGIMIDESLNNTIISNKLSLNDQEGIFIYRSCGNVIKGNILTNNDVAIFLFLSPNNTFRNNQMNGNNGSFEFRFNSLSDSVQDIDTSNTVDGKPIYYWLNKDDERVPSDAAIVALSNCTNVIIQDLQIHHACDSITLFCTNNSVITNNNVHNCVNGISLINSQNINVTENTLIDNSHRGIRIAACTSIIIAKNNITNCGYGIITSGSCANLVICENNISRNNAGIELVSSKESLISKNYFANNRFGINAVSSRQNNITENVFVGNTEGAVRISGAQNNTFYHNNFIDNNASGCQISNPWLVAGNPEDNFWDDGFQGNYWNDFKQRYPNATEITGSGVWNTPYYINEKNIDHYPLVNPYEPEMESQQEPFPTTLIVAATVIIAVVGAALLVYFAKYKKTTEKAE